MSSKLTHSGREAAAERAATVASMWGEGPGSHPSIFPTSVWETQVEARKAAGAWREELLRPIPPRLLGREAFSQDHSDRGPPTMDSRASRMARSNSMAAPLIWEGGQVRMV